MGSLTTSGRATATSCGTTTTCSSASSNYVSRSLSYRWVIKRHAFLFKCFLQHWDASRCTTTPRRSSSTGVFTGTLTTNGCADAYGTPGPPSNTASCVALR